MKTKSKLLQTRMLCGFALLTLGLSLVPVRAADSTSSDADWSSPNPSIPGADGTVYAAAVDGSGNLYIGGSFTMVGGVLDNRIAKWDGSRWTALGSGLSGYGIYNATYVSALAVSGSDLYAGGSFTKAGGKVSPFIARAYLLDLPALSVLRSGSDVTVSWPSANTADFTLEQSTALRAPASWAANTAIVTDDGVKRSVTLSATNSPQFPPSPVANHFRIQD